MPKKIDHIIENGIEKKLCSKCKTYKPLNLFYNNTKRLDKLTPQCKKCQKTTRLIYYKNNKQKLSKRSAEQYIKHKTKIRKRHKKWNKEHPNYNKNLRKKNIEKYKLRDHLYYLENKKKIRISKRKWEDKNRNRLNLKYRTRYSEDIEFKIKN